MYKLKKIVSIMLVLTLTLALPISAFAQKPDWVANKNNSNYQWDNHEDATKNLETLIDELEDLLDWKLGEGDKDFDENLVNSYLNLEVDDLKVKIEDLKEKLEKLEKEEINVLKKNNFKNFNQKNIDKALRKLARIKYSSREINQFKETKEKLLRKYPGISVLDIDSIYSEDVDFKFDTPPVIRSGRTLIPVSAIAKGFKAIVNWYPVSDNAKGDSTGSRVTIEKDGIFIELWIGSNQARVKVNGVYVGGNNQGLRTLDVDAEIMNSRTIVPLRFIAETLRLHVQWNSADRSIKISDKALKTDADGYLIREDVIYLPEGTTQGALAVGLVAPLNGSFALYDEKDNKYTNEYKNEEILETDVVKTFDLYKKVTGLYKIRYFTTLVSSDEAIANVDLSENKVNMPKGTTLGALSILHAPAGDITYMDDDGKTITDTTHSILKTDWIKVTADFGKTKKYDVNLLNN